MAKLALAAAALLLTAFASQASAQAPVDALGAHASALAAEAQEDPVAFAAEAQKVERQQAEVDFARAWGCDVAAEADVDLLEQQGLCPEAIDAAAGAQAREDEVQAVADAEPIADSPQAAAEDEVAAAEGFAQQVLDDPANAPSALAAFAAQTGEFVNRLLGMPVEAFNLLAGAVATVAGVLGQAGAALGGAAGGAVQDAAQGFASAGTGAVKALEGAYQDALAAVDKVVQQLSGPTGAGKAGRGKLPSLPNADAARDAQDLLSNLPIALP